MIQCEDNTLYYIEARNGTYGIVVNENWEIKYFPSLVGKNWKGKNIYDLLHWLRDKYLLQRFKIIDSLGQERKFT